MATFEQAFEQVKQLAEKFHSNLSFYSSATYQEAEARKDFIDKFFIALGWDVNHDHQHNPYEQEVKVEKGQKQQQATSQKRADYAFYTAPNFKDVKLFVEAKKPAVGLRNEGHYFQTIRYGWNANTPVAVLTDFEEFHIIDCRYKPDLRYVFNGQHKEYRYTDYSDKEKFSEIYWLFSREAVINNSLQKFADSLPKPKGKKAARPGTGLVGAAIDDSFLEYIDGIREELAKAFKKNDESLGSEALTEAVTRTIDRLVFIRFLEDKLIEPGNHVSEWRSWSDFITDSRRMEVKYNGVVFKEHPLLDKKGFAGAEEKMFLGICSDIGNLNSPFDFNYIPIHILGSIYERFLGKVVIATEHRARIEEKPEVRKAGGVYYTPKYIVDYIVKNTVWECIKEKTPKEIATLRFADIACGSGSFLIGVYDYLLDYHKKYYYKKYSDRTEPLDARNEDYGNTEYKDGQWILTLKLKQEILLNNIYGVDIDRQAVEVTQLSLFLKMLEDETLSSTQPRQGALFSKVLPDLGKNIICGNSLIGTDILKGQLFSFEEEKKLNPMDFEMAFPAIMRNGGFDAIVGNPPYVTEIFSDKEIKYFNLRYKDTITGKPNLYRLFVHKVIDTLNSKGNLGYIIPNTYLTSRDSISFRNYLLNNVRLKKILYFPESLKVFKGVTQATTVLLFSKGKTENKKPFVASYPITNTNNVDENIFREYYQHDFTKLEGNLFLISRSKKQIDLILKILQSNKRIEDFFFVYQGEINVSINKDIIYEEKRNKFCYPLIRGNNISRYNIDLSFTDSKGSWIDTAKNNFRDHNKVKRVVTQEVSNSQQARRLNGMPIDENIFVGHTANYLLPKSDKSKLEFIIGFLNSYLLDFLFQSFNSTNHIPAGEIKRLPIPEIDKSNKSLHDQLVSHVTQMLEAKKQLAKTQTEGDKNFLENKCSSLDRQIDNLVYKLYGLTEEEIKIVEGA